MVKQNNQSVMKREGIISAGNWIVDSIKFINKYPTKGNLTTIKRVEEGLGGCSHNVLVNLAKLKTNLPLYAGGCVGNDRFGSMAIDAIRQNGIDCSNMRILEGVPTSYTDVMSEIEGTASRTFFQFRGANAELSSEMVLSMNTPARIFHLGYLLLLDKLDKEDEEYGVVAARVLKKLQKKGYKTSVDVVSEESNRFRKIVLPCLKYIDYLIINEVEKVPENFNSWMDKNNSRIQRSKNQPYFIKDNKGTITIPPKNLEELMSRASESSGEVMKLANELAAKYNGYAVPINLKGKERIIEKVQGELKGEITGIKDAVRTTIILSQKDLKNIIVDSEKMSIFVRVKHQTPDKFSGYSGLLTNIRTKNGIQGEIQFNTAKMIYAKEKPKDAKFLLGVEKWNAIKKETGMPGGLGHKYYEQMRVLDEAKDASLYEALEKKSIEYYKHFR